MKKKCEQEEEVMIKKVHVATTLNLGRKKKKEKKRGLIHVGASWFLKQGYP